MCVCVHFWPNALVLVFQLPGFASKRSTCTNFPVQWQFMRNGNVATYCYQTFLVYPVSSSVSCSPAHSHSLVLLSSRSVFPLLYFTFVFLVLIQFPIFGLNFKLRKKILGASAVSHSALRLLVSIAVGGGAVFFFSNWTTCCCDTFEECAASKEYLLNFCISFGCKD